MTKWNIALTDFFLYHHRYFHPVSTLAIREGISTSLSELEQVSEEIKSLELQCQVQKHRIRLYSQLSVDSSFWKANACLMFLYVAGESANCDVQQDYA